MSLFIAMQLTTLIFNTNMIIMIEHVCDVAGHIRLGIEPATSNFTSSYSIYIVTDPNSKVSFLTIIKNKKRM